MKSLTFHPEYTYSQFVGSYKPVTGPTGEIRYDFVPGPFMRVLVAALKSGRTESPQPHLLLIEEIKRYMMTLLLKAAINFSGAVIR